MTRPTALIFDFDSTLAHYVEGYDGLFEIFTQRGLADELVRSTYRRVTDEQGFSIAKLADALDPNKTLDRDALNQEFLDWLKQNLVLYPEVASVLEQLRTAHYPIIILTFGDAAFQQQKIASVGLTVDRVVIIENAAGKPAALQKLLEEFGAPIMFVDDKGRDIDRIREAKLAADEVFCVRMLRPDSPYRDEPTAHSAPTIDSLTELTSLLA